MNVNLHIERLILDGIDVEPGLRPVLQAAIEAELGRLLAKGGIGPELAGGTAVPAVRAGGFQMSGTGNPRQLGRQIARAVYGGLGSEASVRTKTEASEAGSPLEKGNGAALS